MIDRYTYSLDLGVVASKIPEDPIRFESYNNFNHEEWHKALKAEVFGLITKRDLKIKSINRPVEPMVISQFTGFNTNLLYTAISK